MVVDKMPAPRVMLASLIILALLFPCTTLSAQSTSTTTNTPFSIDTSFSVLPLSNLVVSGNVYITDPNVANGASISYVTWDWGDGTISAWVPASGPAALTAFPGQHTYLSSGPYQVNVLVGDSAEATGNATGQVQVPGPKFVSPNSIVSFASITVSGHTATPNLIITDPNVATGASLVAEDWSWGDGSADATWGSSQSSSPPSGFPGSHTYSFPGLYQVGVNVVDSSGALGGVQQLLIAESTSMGGGSTCIPTPQKPCDTLSSSSNIVTSNTYPPGTGFSAITGPTQPYSPEGQVNSSNAANALWLLTCPSVPGSGGADQYFTANPNFGGDACLQHPTSYTSRLGVQTSVTPGYYPGINYDSAADCWDCSGSTSITASPIVGLMTQGSTEANAPTQSNVLGFTAQADNAISSTFSNSSYAYQLPTAQTQHALWTWSYEMPTMLPPVKGQGPVSYSPSNQMLVNQNNAGGYGWNEIIISCGYSGCSESTSSCSYSSYSYSGNSTIYYALNGGATFMEASGAQFSTPIMPFFSYRIKVPAPFGQQLNLSYDIFSPSQYQNPANNIDALPVDVGSQFFVEYNYTTPQNANKGGNMTLAMAPQSSFASQWGTPKMTVTEKATDAQWDARNMQTNPSNGKPFSPPFCQMQVATDMNGNPIYAQYFTDSLYCRFCQDPANTVISYGTCVYYQCDKHGQNCVQKPGSFPYPTYFGECNQMSYSGFSPPDQQPESSYPWCQPNNGGIETVTSAIANAISIQAIPTDYIFVLNRSADNSYHISVLQMIPQGRYDVGKPNLPTTTDPTIWYIDWVQYWKQVIQAQSDYMYLVGSYNIGSLAPGFTPINMSVDYTGNVFLVGTMTETINQNTANVPALAEITGVTTGNVGGSANIISPNGKFDNTDSPTMSEIAVSPTGQNVFIANQSVGYIYVYSGSSPFAYQNQIDLSYTQSNPSTKQTSSLNINYWLENNGLYNQQLSWLPDYLQGYSPQQNTMLDAPTYHHPVGLQDVNGYLYVMDNWAGGIDLSTTQSSNNYQGVFFSALVLRAMNSSGLNIPLSPSYFNDLFSSGTCSLGVQGSQQPISQGVCTSLPNGAQATCAPSTACSLSTTKCYAGGKPLSTNSYSCDATGSQSTNYTSLSTVAPFAQNFYPPFGWIISANVVGAQLTQVGLGNGYDVSVAPGEAFSACVASSGQQACDFNPQDASQNGYSGTFQTIGPHILAIDSQYATSACTLWIVCTAASGQAEKQNGDVRGAFAPYYYATGFSVSFNQSISMLFTNHTIAPDKGAGCVILCEVIKGAGAGNPNLYNELFFSSLNIQNYTSLFDGNSNFACYTSSTASGTGCSSLQSVQYMQPPLYNMPDPFKYLESLGSTQYLSFPEFQSSGLTTGIDKNVANSQAQQCAQTGNCGSNSASQIVSQAQGSLSANPGLAVGVSSPETVNITVTGDVLLPYTFSDVVHQSWSNFKNGMCCYSSSGGRVAYHKCQASSGGFFASPPGSYSVTEYTFTDAPVSGNSLVLPVEGGYTYLQDLFSSSYLHVNTSTVGIVPPQIYTLLQSDRLFSDILINMTTNNMHGGNGNQYIINATHSRNYYITNYMQGSNPGYEVVNSIELYPAQYGTTAVPNALDNSGVAPSKQLVSSNYLGANAFFNFNTIGAAAINLFSFIKSVSYNSNLNLSFANTTISSGLVSTTYNALGYNRLILMFRDRFNNTISLPLDLDIAKISTLKLNVTPVVNTINPNKTMLEINGLATYLFNGNTYPINGIPVYLYYDRNINFALHNPNQDTANAILCAFASNTAGIPSNCTIANPINPLQSKNATVKTFATAYNALGDCGPAPNSLLTVESTNCNIYGNDGTKAIPNTCQAAGQYCLPQFSNGTGVCTSQLGLIGSVNTNANGQFSLQTTVCGIGNADILASLYGEPGPEPNTVIQTPISLSANAALTCSNPSGCIKTSVYNYFVSPSSAAQSVPIGEFELSYGAISSILASIIAIAAIAAYAIIARSRKAIYRKKGIK